MNELIIAAGSCFLIGLMTTLHPCPLTTNIAAVTMLTGWSKRQNKGLVTALFFILGYVCCYAVLAMLLSFTSLSFELIANTIQKVFGKFLGIIFIIVGMLLTDLLQLNKFYKAGFLKWAQKRDWTAIQAFPLGLIIALSFCPATAALFFALLLPLAVQHNQMLLFPIIYALGAGLPLLVISYMIYKGTAIAKHAKWRRHLPIAAGTLLIIIGIILTIKRIYLA